MGSSLEASKHVRQLQQVLESDSSVCYLQFELCLRSPAETSALGRVHEARSMPAGLPLQDTTCLARASLLPEVDQLSRLRHEVVSSVAVDCAPDRLKVL